MLVRDITKIIRVLLAAFEAMASQDDLTQRRIGQIGEVIGAVEDVAKREDAANASQEGSEGGGAVEGYGAVDGGAAQAARRVDEAHDIIHRVAAILAMENESDGQDGKTGQEDRIGMEDAI